MAPERIEPAVRLKVFWQLSQVKQDFCSVWESKVENNTFAEVKELKDKQPLTKNKIINEIYLNSFVSLINEKGRSGDTGADGV